jgi:hypothetical protein
MRAFGIEDVLNFAGKASFVILPAAVIVAIYLTLIVPIFQQWGAKRYLSNFDPAAKTDANDISIPLSQLSCKSTEDKLASYAFFLRWYYKKGDFHQYANDIHRHVRSSLASESMPTGPITVPVVAKCVAEFSCDDVDGVLSDSGAGIVTRWTADSAICNAGAWIKRVSQEATSYTLADVLDQRVKVNCTGQLTYATPFINLPLADDDILVYFSLEKRGLNVEINDHKKIDISADDIDITRIADRIKLIFTHAITADVVGEYVQTDQFFLTEGSKAGPAARYTINGRVLNVETSRCYQMKTRVDNPPSRVTGSQDMYLDQGFMTDASSIAHIKLSGIGVPDTSHAYVDYQFMQR